MPMNFKLYPSDWCAIATEIKEKVNWQCENCGRPCRRPLEQLAGHGKNLYAIQLSLPLVS
jgi:hypothetical protein